MAANDIKKIKTSELQLGMYLVGFDGQWLANPFWSSRFMLSNADDLRLARSSGVAQCYIDVSLGLDIAPAAADRPAHRPATPAADLQHHAMQASAAVLPERHGRTIGHA